MSADNASELAAALADRYRLERELGAGGMATVYLADDLKHQRRVAVKVLRPELAQSLGAERFLREIQIAAGLNHPHIVSLIDSGEARGFLYYVMPHVEGESLRARLEREGALSVADGTRILRDVLDALVYAHEQGVVHRDIKPENIMLAGRHALVMDFGIAKAVVAAASSERMLTTGGLAVGTPAYMAPEQATGDAVTASADLYAWGVVAYEMLGGAHPFANKATAQQIVAAQISERPAPLSAFAPSISPALATIVMKCLEKEPAARGEAATLLAALESPRLLETQSARPLPAHPGRRGGSTARRWTTAGSILLVAVAGAALGWPRLAVLMHKPRSATSITTVAVMPFVNTGGNAGDEYFSDGMTDELAHALSQLPSLRVAGRTSSYVYKGKSVSAQEIGRTLDVAGIVEGTVRRAGDRLRITAQLTDASDGLVIWSDTYESRATDIFQVQDQFTREIVTALEPALRGRTAATVANASRGTADPVAYDLYLRGRYFWAKRSGANILRSIDYFKQAIARDPLFARAHAGLAMAYIVLPLFIEMNTDSVFGLSEASANRALALDSALGDAHLALAEVDHQLARPDEAERKMRLALDRQPDDPMTLMWHAENLGVLGLVTEALAEDERAATHDPLSAVIAASVSTQLYLTRDFARSIALSRRALELDSSFTFAYTTIATASMFDGRIPAAVAAAETAFARDSTIPGLRGVLVLVYAAAGRWDDAERLRAAIRLAHERRRPRKGDAISYDDLAAALAFGISTTERASLIRRIDWTDMLIETSGMCDPLFDQLKSDPMFAVATEAKGMKVCASRTPWPIKPRPNGG